MSYFEQTKLGESRWWSWIAVTWLAFVGWVFFQTVLFFIPTMAIANFTSPPLIEPLMAAITNSAGSENAQALGNISMLSGLGAVAAILVGLTAEGTARKIGGILAGVGIVVSIVTSVLSSQGADSSVVMDVISQVMGASPVAFALFLLTFPTGLIALYFGQRLIHKRSLLSLHTAATKFRWMRVLQGFVLTWIVLGAFALGAEALGIIEVQYVFAGGKFWIFAIVSLLFIPFQSATEEIVFRGYFNQGLTYLFKSKWIAFALTSLAFMALHLSNPEALEGSASGTLPIVMSGYFFFGFAMCLIVWIDDGLETAIGIHAGNNCFAAIIMNYENSVLPTPSVFLTGTDPVKDSISTVLVLATLVGIIWFWRRGSKSRAL
ncbi:MAG: CPBP family intramembrane glutamic endopeptidase [Litorimonas sp.]